MKRLLSTVAVFILLGALGVLTVIAMPRGLDVATAAPSVRQAVPDSPTALQNYNAIALPLDVQANWAAEGFDFDAQGLADYLGASSIEQVLRLKASRQDFDSWFPAFGFGFVDGAFVTEPYPLQTGLAYRILINSSDPDLTRLSIVGDVPPAGSITFTLVGASPACKYNDVLLPLDQPAITDADQLAASMGGPDNVDQVLRLNAPRQDFDSWFPAFGFGFVDGAFVTEPFDVRIGYPYTLCLKAGANDLPWPS